MKITRRFIAQKAGVSPATVSGVLNQDPHIRTSVQTKERILRLVKEYNYFPDVSARSLVMQKTFNIGLINTIPIASFLNDPYTNSIFIGAESEIEKRGYSFLFSLLKSDENINLSVRKMLLGKTCDGILLFRHIGTNLRKLLLESKVKFVLIDNYYSDFPCVSILADNFSGGYMAAQYLIRKGNKKVICINGDEPHPCYRERPEGYTKAMNEAGLQTKVLNGPPDMQNTYALVTRIVENGDVPEAIFAAGEHMAVGTIRALLSKGIKVPDDVRVIGFDNTYLSESEKPGITVVDIPKIEMGSKAVQLLMEPMGISSSMVIRVPVSIVERQSA